MNIDAWLRMTTTVLKDQDIPTARLDCLILLEDCLNKDRAHILAHLDQELTPEQIEWLKLRVERRKKHEPMAYIRQKCEFYGRLFFVDNHVLVPRAETEPIITLLKNIPGAKHARIADIGSGSGCLGITAALELPSAHVDLYDIDESTFAVAAENAKKHHATVSFHKGDLLQNLKGSYDVLLANLPYVPNDAPENIDVYFEPSHALFAGNDGLNLYRDFWKQVAERTDKPQYILTEARPGSQHPVLVDLAKEAGYSEVAVDYFVQQFALD